MRTAAVKKIEKEALRLSPRSRARLAELLISSLESESDADAEEEWVAEITRRAAELAGGRFSLTPADEVLRKARSAFK
jgi:putative addiction module component (TIGR02574 family)